MLERLEDRMLLDALGTDPLIFDPTPGNASSGDEVIIGSINYELVNANDIKVTYTIEGSANRAMYDLSAVETKINGGDLGSQSDANLADNTESFSHIFPLGKYLPLSVPQLDIDACATVAKKPDVSALGASLPAIGTVKVSTNGNIIAPASYFDTVITPGWIPSDTDVGNDTLTFAKDTGWATGDAVRVVAGFGAAVTGLVTPPAASDTTTSATYFVRNLGLNTYSFHLTYNDAVAGSNARDIIAPVPVTGEIIITGENDALPFLGQTPINESVVPTSTKTALTTTTGPLVTATDTGNDTVDLSSAQTWVTGDRVRISGVSDGGLNANTTYYLRVVDADTVSFYTTWASAQANTSRVNINAAIATTRTIDPVSADDETVSFATDPGWATGTGVRVNTSGGGLNAGTTYFARSLGAGVYSFYATQAEALNIDANADPLSGRRDLTAAITASLFANLNTLSFENPHGWSTGTVLRANTTGGGLSSGSNYYVRAIDDNTISLHTSLANAQGNISPLTFTEPVTALLTPMFNGWCIDNDRFIGGNEYIANIYSSYELNSFPDTTLHPKDSYGTEAGISPINTSMVPATTDLTNDRLTFTANHTWATGQAVRVTDTDNALVAGTDYYIRVTSVNTVSFHTTAAGATANTGRVDLTAPLSASTTVFRSQSLDFAANTQWPNGTRIMITVDDGGLLASQVFYSRAQNQVGAVQADANSISLYDTREHAILGGATGLITLTDPIETSTVFYVPENLVENPENLDVMNWVLNQNYESQLAVGKAVTATSHVDSAQTPLVTIFDNVGLTPDATDTAAETVTFTTDPGWATGTLVRVDATVGGLSPASNYYVRNLTGGVYSFYSSAANATAGGTTGRTDLKVAIATEVFAPTLLAEDTITFNPGHGFVNGSIVNVSADGGGLDASTTYYLYSIDANTFSIHTAAAATVANKVNLTAAVEPRAVYLQTENTVSVPAYGWTTGMAVQVSASGGGLTVGTDYFVRAINSTTLAFYASSADASNNVNRIDLTGDIQPTLIRPYYTSADVQRAVWELIENTPNTGVGSIDRANEILFAANAAVGIGLAEVSYIPDCGETVAVILQPIEIDQGSNEQITIAQITIAQIPSYCAVGQNCQELLVTLGKIGDTVWLDTNGNGLQTDESGTGVAGVTVNLLDRNGNVISGGYTTTTDSSGKYLFERLLPGTYTVQFVSPAGYVFTKQNEGADDEGADKVDSDANPADGKTATYTLLLTPAVGDAAATVGTRLDADAGLFKPISISGVKVWDIDRDGATGGISDSGDQRIAGVRMFLDTDNDSTFDYTDTDGSGTFNAGDVALEQYAITDGNGAYSFTNLGPGTYNVQEDKTTLPGNPAEWQSSGAPAPIAAVSGVNITNADFYNYKFPPGEYQTYSLGGYGGKGQPGQYLVANFASAFPTGLVVPRAVAGTTSDITLGSATEVQGFLNATNNKKFSNGSVSNYAPSTLEKQFVALSLSVGFDAYSPSFGSSTGLLGDLTLYGLTGSLAPANGLTISGFLSQVYNYLDGDLTTADGDPAYTLGLSAGDLTNLLGNLNIGFDMTVTPWAETHLQ